MGLESRQLCPKRRYLSNLLLMSVSKPRTKVVFFRVSAEEFRELEILCSRVGARSISELARAAARRWMDESRVEHLDGLFEKLASFEQALDELQAKVQRYRLVHVDGGSSGNANAPRERET